MHIWCLYDTCSCHVTIFLDFRISYWSNDKRCLAFVLFHKWWKCVTFLQTRQRRYLWKSFHNLTKLHSTVGLITLTITEQLDEICRTSVDLVSAAVRCVVRKGDHLTTFTVPKVEKIRSFNLSEPVGPPRPIAGHLCSAMCV